MGEGDNKYIRERDYNERTQRVLVQRVGRVTVVRLGRLRYHEERHDEAPQYLNLSGGGPGIVTGPPKTTPAKLAIDTVWFKPVESARFIRKPKAADVRKLERLETRITELQKQRRDLLAEAFERADVVPAEKLVWAAEKNLDVAKAGFRSNSRVPRV